MQDAPAEHEEVEDAMAVRHLLFSDVEHNAQGVEHAAADKERHSGQSDPARKRDRDREREPTHEEIEKDGKRAAAAAQEKLLEDSDGCKRPDDKEQGIAYRAPKGIQGKWRIGPGDQKVDARVIELSKDRLRPAAQRVIERREQIQRHERDAIDGEAQSPPRVRLAHRDPDERDKAGRRQDRADEVGHAVEDLTAMHRESVLRMFRIGLEVAETELPYLFAARGDHGTDPDQPQTTRKSV